MKGLTGLALGLIMVGTADHTVAMEMLQTLMERSEAELSDPNMRFLALGIALIFLGEFYTNCGSAFLKKENQERLFRKTLLIC